MLSFGDPPPARPAKRNRQFEFIANLKAENSRRHWMGRADNSVRGTIQFLFDKKGVMFLMVPRDPDPGIHGYGLHGRDKIRVRIHHDQSKIAQDSLLIVTGRLKNRIGILERPWSLSHPSHHLGQKHLLSGRSLHRRRIDAVN